MADRAKKLAAARKKLKAYQSKDNAGSYSPLQVDTHEETAGTPPHDEIHLPSPEHQIESNIGDTAGNETVDTNTAANVDVIEMLLSEKGAITSELTKYKSLCREQTLEIEETNTKLASTLKRLGDLETNFIQLERKNEDLQEENGRLSLEVSQSKSHSSKQADYIEELKNTLAAETVKIQQLESRLNENINESELNKLRSQQITETTTDNRIESLMQTKFMYEQQIRDLQAMVQQMTQDKEQSSQQYQTYAQHLNHEISTLSEKNWKLLEENSKLDGRVKSFIVHISGLEKQIQQNIQIHKQNEIISENVTDLEKQVHILTDERQVLIDQVKLQKDKIEEIERLVDLKTAEIYELQAKSVQSTVEPLESPVTTIEDEKKLLAKMESDQIAASRALIQNEELKNQLNELQIKFIQLTNDKVELVNKLDLEEFTNKDIRNNYHVMKDELDKINEKLHFKDEEMIRLSHENNDLKIENFEIKHKNNKEKRITSIPNQVDSENFIINENTADMNGHNHDNCNDHHDHEHSHEHNHDHSHDHNNDHSHDHNHDHSHDHSSDHSHDHSHENENHSDFGHTKDVHSDCHSHTENDDSSNVLPSEKAMEKLQARFTKLMREVADLTDEKQRLEHLVLQLQGETETIGEYITLYQTQRKILKQREYERINQLQRLEADRHEMLGKVTSLNALIKHLGIDVNSAITHVQPNNSIETIEPQVCLDNAGSDSKLILQKIQNIITEIEVNSHKELAHNMAAVDHCSCCSGELETI